MKNLLKNKKFHIISTCSAVAVAGILLFQGSIPSDARQVKFNTILPNQGVAGTEVVISGSGFTSSIQGITGTKVNDKVYAPGNYVLLQGDIIAGPILSPDGKTLTARISVDSEKVRMYCEEKFRSKEPCKVQAKVVNAYSKQSNGQYFTILYSAPPIAQSCTLTVSIASTTPAPQNISPGQSAVSLVKFNAIPNCDGTLRSFAVTLLPMPNGYQNMSALRLYNDVSGMQLGAIQSVTGAGMNFTLANLPLTANQTLVLKVVGDVSPSATNGSTIYAGFGGSSAVDTLGGMIVNNASGNIIVGNTMTVANTVPVAATQYIAPGTNPRIMYWWGKVNQHTDTNGNWLTDSDGVSGADLDKLTYCKKFYQNTMGVEDYMLETTDTWRDRGNVGGPYTSTKMSTRCLQPN